MQLRSKAATKTVRKRRFKLGVVALYGASRMPKPSRLWRALPTTTLLMFFILTLAIQSFSPFITTRSYELSDQVRSLTGESRDDTTEYLKLNKDSSGYSFSVPETEEANAVHTGRIADAYSASLSANPKDGITVTEKNSKIAVTLIPDFYTQTGQKVDGDHIVYPTGPDKLVYTLKYNGLKEDIIVPEYRADELNYKFTLRLPSGAEARLDEQGSIGIYSSDPTLFGDISFGSDEDREKVERARENGEKNHLVMTIPYPIIKDATGKEYTDRSNFELGDKQQSKNEEIRNDLPPEIPRSLITTNDYQLTIKSQNLKDLTYPIAIDPTMQINDANEFSGVMARSGVDIDLTDGVIRRSSLTGGELGAWVTASAITRDTTHSLGTAVIDRNLVILYSGGYEYIDIVADPSLSGTFTWVPNTSGSFGGHVRASYNNGYWYVAHADGVRHSTTRFSIGKGLTASGTISYTTDERRGTEHIIYNNRIYVSGGCVTDTDLFGNPGCANNSGKNFVSMAPLNADGSLGSWTNWNGGGDPVMSSRRTNHRMVVVDGYLYVGGGCTEGTGGGFSCGGTGSATYVPAVEFTKINADGTLSGFTTTTNIPWSNSAGDMFEHAGYLYIYRAQRGVPTGEIVYAEIKADKSLGVWRNTSPLNLARAYMSRTIVYENRVYTFAGCINSGECGANSTNTIEYADIKPAGYNETLVATTPLPVATSRPATAVYNGYIYAVSGCTDMSAAGGNCQSTVAAGYPTTAYYAPINSDGTIGTWNTTTALGMNQGRFQSATLVHNGRMYIIGGRGPCGLAGAVSNACDQIFYASFNSNGTLGAWSSSLLSTALLSPSAVAWNDRLYIAGGQNGSSTYLTNVEHAPINANGSIGLWTQATADLPEGLHLGSHGISGNTFIVAGGWDGASRNEVYTAQIQSNNDIISWTTTTSLPNPEHSDLGLVHNSYFYFFSTNTTYFAKINSDGTVGTWETGGPKSQNRGMIGSEVYNGNVYAIGGNNGETERNTVDFAPINNGGSGHISSWSSTTSLATARRGHGSVVYGGYLYVLGGMDVTGLARSDVLYAQINADGTLGSWNTTTSMPQVRHSFGVGTYNGFLYTFGGATDVCFCRHTRYAPINANGTIGAWSSSTELNTDRTELKAGIYNGFAYVFGGRNSGSVIQSTVEYAPINPDGSLGAWQFTASLLAGVKDFGVLLHRGYFYIAGGRDAGTTYYSKIQSAQIQSNGTLANWVHAGNLPIKTGYLELASLNGYVYSLGGIDEAGGWRTTVNRASIIVDGKLGDFTQVSGFATARGHFQTPTHNNRIYAVGGYRFDNIYYNEVLVTSPQSIPRTGSFTRRYDFGSGVKPTKLITRGTKQAGASVSVATSDSAACGATAYDAPVNNPGIGYGGDNGLDINIGSSQTLAQCLLLRYTIDDTQSAVFPDEGNESTITDLDLYFTANPGSRLRGGRTFTNGSDRGLDAAPQ